MRKKYVRFFETDDVIGYYNLDLCKQINESKNGDGYYVVDYNGTGHSVIAPKEMAEIYVYLHGEKCPPQS